MTTQVLFGARSSPPPQPPTLHYNPTIGNAFGVPDQTFPIGSPVRPHPDIAGRVTLGSANVASRANVVGLTATPSAVGDRVHVQNCGPLELTTEQWDLLTGDTGGLVAGATYYLAFGHLITITGKLTRTRATSVDTFVVRVGVGLGPRTMMVQLSSPLVGSTLKPPP